MPNTSHVLKNNISIQRCVENETIPSAVKLKKWAKLALIPGQSVCLRIVELSEIHELNKQYRHKDKPTNVLSFPSDWSDLPLELHEQMKDNLGDIILCAEVIEQEAMDQHKSLEHHWAHLVIHGVLHLQGFDHECDADATIMESKEIELLNTLNIANPYI